MPTMESYGFMLWAVPRFHREIRPEIVKPAKPVKPAKNWAQHNAENPVPPSLPALAMESLAQPNEAAPPPRA